MSDVFFKLSVASSDSNTLAFTSWQEVIIIWIYLFICKSYSICHIFVFWHMIEVFIGQFEKE